jgi:cell division protein FtsI/penicillin-binding protein 2
MYRYKKSSFSKRGYDKTSIIGRMRFLRFFLLFFASVLALRLFNLQIISYAEYKAAADGEHQFFKKLIPYRGEIFLRETHTDTNAPYLLEVAGEKVFPAVTNREYALAYAVPKDVQDTEKTAEALSHILEMEKDDLKVKLERKNTSYVVLKRKLSDEKADQIKDIRLSGIFFNTETYRFYPEKLGGHIFGFVGYAQDGKGTRGLYGLEGYFNGILKGKEGSLRSETDAIGTLIPVGETRIIDAIDGASLILTIDRTVQMVACDRLQKWVARHGADGGTVIIVEPQTGAILAMCAVPDFNPDDRSETDVNVYNNPAIFSPYEPGSIFKPITVAMGIDLHKITPQTTYIDTGSVKIASYIIKNSDEKAHGKQTMVDVLDESLNTGVIFIERKVGLDNFRKYVKEFGFGALTGIELDTETTGNISTLNTNNEIYFATASFGQGLTVTPLQMVMSYATLANGGRMMQPYIVHKIIRPDGNIVETKPKEIRQVISEQTASLLSGMLVSVVQKGHGKRAGVKGYYVAGKTGTAQIPRKDKRGYEENASIGSFAGFAPVDNPRFAMLVKIDRPRDVEWAESSAAPLFGDIAQFLLTYYEVPPDDTQKK